MKKLRVGITGNIGSGKSTVAGIFAALGAPVYDSDNRAKALITDPLKPQIVAMAGSDIFATSSGQIDKKLLASRIFNSEELKLKIESIVHPAVVADFINWADKQPFPYVVIESALLFSSPYLNNVVQQTIVVTCPIEMAIKRTMVRDGITAEQVKERLKNQISAEELVKKGDFVIVTDEKELLVPKILSLHNIFINFASI